MLGNNFSNTLDKVSASRFKKNHVQYIYSGCTCTAQSTLSCTCTAQNKCKCTCTAQSTLRWTCTAQTIRSCHINNMNQEKKIMFFSAKLGQKHSGKEESLGLKCEHFKGQLSFSCAVSVGLAGLTEGNSPSTQFSFFKIFKLLSVFCLSDSTSYVDSLHKAAARDCKSSRLRL